jgi:hypothetical protein
MNTKKGFDAAAVIALWILCAIVMWHEKKLVMTLVALFVLLFITWAVLFQSDDSDDNDNKGGYNDGLV